MSTLENYIADFSRLRSDHSAARWASSTRHRAPHKPLLLLAVLDLFAEGTVTSNLIEPSPELAESFTLYWARVMPPDQRGNLALPFFHLQRDGFWHLLPAPGKESFVAAVRQISSINELRETVIGAKLDDALSSLLCIEEPRETLRRVLVETYFAPEAQASLTDQGIVNREAYQYSEGLLMKAKGKLAREGVLDELADRPVVRDQGFRRAIIGVYDHTCAFCGLRVLTPDGHTAADAAHIVPWSRTHNDAVENGMALCKLCHWGFDEGLLAASAHYAVVVSPRLEAHYNNPRHLRELKGKPMVLPKDRPLWPDLEALRRHRAEVYQIR